MLSFLLRSVFLGLATAAVVLLAVPSLRNNVIPVALDQQPKISHLLSCRLTKP